MSIPQFKFNATLDIKPEQLEAIIKQAVETQQQGFTVERVEFTGTSAGYDCRDNSSYGYKLTGAKVHLVPKPSYTGQFHR